jgi:hypothetical protein
MLDYKVLVNVVRPELSDPQRLYNPEDMDFRLRPRSAAIDAGMELATITDGYAGKAPDLGAYEFGQTLPDYGPRALPTGVSGPEEMGYRSWNGPPRPDLHLLPQGSAPAR